MKNSNSSTILGTWKQSFISIQVITHGVAEYHNGVG